MKNSQLPVTNETFSSDLSFEHQTPSKSHSKTTPFKTPEFALPKPKPLHTYLMNSLEQQPTPSHQLSARQGFWLKFEKNSEASSCVESESDDDSYLSDIEDVSDGFFEFEIDENGNWSSKSSSQDILSDNEEDHQEANVSSTSLDAQMSPLKDENLEESKIEITTEVEKEDLKQSGEIIEPKKRVGDDVGKSLKIVDSKLFGSENKKSKKVTSLKDFRRLGLVDSFKSLNTSIVYDFCKNVSLIVG
jgi:hypothetical protein